MDSFITIEQIDEAADVIERYTDQKPLVGMVLGSGLGELAEDVTGADKIPYEKIPHWPSSTVSGHHGQLVIGELGNKTVLIMQGRVHYYEGYSIYQVTFPVRVMQRLGIKSFIVTNAAGGINQSFMTGDLMLITDHINLLGMAGVNPLRGPNIEEFGERFPDMSQVYDRNLGQAAREVAAKNNITLQEGVYICLSGPNYETPADLRFLQTIGADAVGMSTVHEVTVARHGGMRVLGISGISNVCSLDGEHEATHEEVKEAGMVLVPKLKTVVMGVLQTL